MSTEDDEMQVDPERPSKPAKHSGGNLYQRPEECSVRSVEPSWKARELFMATQSS